MSEKRIQVNAEVSIDLVERLDEMCLADENNRSQFIRKLIRLEWERRQKKKKEITENGRGFERREEAP